MVTLTSLAIAAACLWTVILLFPWRPWATSEVLDAGTDQMGEDLGDITVLIPARNEAAVIQRALLGVRKQGGDLPVVLVDDRSTDQTVSEAGSVGLKNLRIIRGDPPPEGWSGKLWALEQGLRHVQTGLLLLLDADIELQPGILGLMEKKMREEGLALLSLMASLRMVGFWERAFMPAFVYFFKMLYPFRLSNRRGSSVAAAAGGCILLRREALDACGGFRALRHELIDDCALAARVKSAGGRTWIGLSHSVISLRAYPGLAQIGDMIARTAFHQLRYSIPWLLICTAGMALLFLVPPAGLWFPSPAARVLSVWAFAAMAVTYAPVLLFYHRSMGWVLGLPLIATAYLVITWISAVRFWQGKGAVWKGRSYGSRRT